MIRFIQMMSELSRIHNSSEERFYFFRIFRFEKNK